MALRSHAALRWSLVLLAAAAHARMQLQATSAPAGPAPPSWWECLTCSTCLLSDVDVPPPPRAAWASLGACATCSGCTHHVEELPATFTLPDAVDAVAAVPIRYGSTGAALFLATDAKGRQEVLKLHGTAAESVSAAKMRDQRRRYGTRRYLPQELAFARVLTPLAEACGLGHVSAAERVTRVRAVLPATGQQLSEAHAVLAEQAAGVSLDILTLKLRPDALLKRLAAVSHEAVRDAALYDLLFAQGDRHAENVFIDDLGAMKLIDSRDAALRDGLNSCFLPGSYYFERARVGVEHISNASRPAVSHHWPQLLLDYRCHVPGGAIGTNYPPKMRDCLAAWSSGSAPQLYDTHFAAAAASCGAAERGDVERALRLAATRLHKQARALQALGFEGALDAATADNLSRRVPFRNGFAKTPPCCAMEAVPADEARRGRPFRCAPGGEATLPADYKQSL